MKTYVVGGAVRDRLLGLPVKDRDHVVIGATVDEMLAAGFKPVGRDFPVFLHPTTHEEYALARTERKVAPGYAGFVFHADPTVTLEADLERRDLTINAIAEDEASGQLIDPFDGQGDLTRRVFRHVGPAFLEDPVRVLRIARFAARFADFSVAPETLSLMQTMVDSGEIDALVSERVWQEISRGLMEAHPPRMFDVLREAHAFTRLFPEFAWQAADASQPNGPWQQTMRALERAARQDAIQDVRFAVFTHTIGAQADNGASLESLCERLAVPRNARELAMIVSKEGRATIESISSSTNTTLIPSLVDLTQRCDAFRRGERFDRAIEAIALTIDDASDRATFTQRMAKAMTAARSVDAAAIAKSVDFDPRRIATDVRDARINAIASRWH
jgi:tRNA nucleotidyltransferase (CCA-adding enzyme)